MWVLAHCISFSIILYMKVRYMFVRISIFIAILRCLRSAASPNTIWDWKRERGREMHIKRESSMT